MAQPNSAIENIVRLMTEGGDARLHLDPRTGLNRYFSAPRPSKAIAYASSTANDISEAAFAHVAQVAGEIGTELAPADYTVRLEAIRGRIRRAYGVAPEVAIVLSASGTDLEYVALACVAGLAPQGVHNILLGADEVGSGCIHSAHGYYFADETPLGVAVSPGLPVPGLGGPMVDLVDLKVRDERDRPRPSGEIAALMAEAVRDARAAGRHALVHIVHGSKTGLILPSLADADVMSAEHGEAISLVVDACQARIAAPAVADYLERDAMVFVTGSKFMGGPPFSGFALVPARFRREAQPLPAGLATIFRRAEWPLGWPGADGLPESANPGLLLRLEASLYELERFLSLPSDAIERVILAFHAAVRFEIIEKSPAHRVAPYPPGEKIEADTHPIEMRTLSTLDLTELCPEARPGGATFEDAQGWHKAMAEAGVRLGQPVKCVHLGDGRWGATLRIGLSMPIVSDHAALDDAALAAAFERDMAAVREALTAACATTV